MKKGYRLFYIFCFSPMTTKPTNQQRWYRNHGVRETFWFTLCKSPLQILETKEFYIRLFSNILTQISSNIAAEVYFNYPPITIMRSSEQGLKTIWSALQKRWYFDERIHWPVTHVRYIKILTWVRAFRGQNCKFFTIPLSRNSQKSLEHKENQTKYRDMTRKPRSHDRI